MKILGLESSCDDTGAAVVEAAHDGSFQVLSNIIATQNHVATGGVVPEVAARHHASAVLPAIEQALEEAQTTIDEIECIAVTRGPGMIAGLLVGVEAATTIAATRNIPIIGVNHMEAHMASTFAEHPQVEFPAVALLISGGHTLLIQVNEIGSYALIGTTRDDAAGEAFDKIAKMIDLPYPGGPEIARLAENGNPHAYDFPRPMMQSEDFDFSFAGLKTAVLYHLQKDNNVTEKDKADIAASVQEAIVDVAVAKTVRAATVHHAQTIILGGGVSANLHLQQRLKESAAEHTPDAQVLIPSAGLFTDNGAMIAIAAAPRALRGAFDDWRAIQVDPKLKLAE